MTSTMSIARHWYLTMVTALEIYTSRQEQRALSQVTLYLRQAVRLAR